MGSVHLLRSAGFESVMEIKVRVFSPERAMVWHLLRGSENCSTRPNCQDRDIFCMYRYERGGKGNFRQLQYSRWQLA